MQKTQQHSPRTPHPASLIRVNAVPTCVVSEINRTMPQISIFNGIAEGVTITTTVAANGATSSQPQCQITPSFHSTNGSGVGQLPLVGSTALLALPSNLEGGVAVPLTSEVVVIKSPSLSSGAHAKHLSSQWVLQKQPVPQLVPILPQEVIQQIVVGKPPQQKSNPNTLLKAQLNSASPTVPPTQKLLQVKQYPGQLQQRQQQQQKTQQIPKQKSSPQKQTIRPQHFKQPDQVQQQQSQPKQQQQSPHNIVQKLQLKPILPKQQSSQLKRQFILPPPARPHQLQQQQQAQQKTQKILQQPPQQQLQNQSCKPREQQSREELIEQHVHEKRQQMKQLQLKQQQQKNQHQLNEQLQQEQKQLLKERHQQNRQLLQQQLQQAMKQAEQRAKKQNTQQDSQPKRSETPKPLLQKQILQLGDQTGQNPPLQLKDDLIETSNQLPLQKHEPRTINKEHQSEPLPKQQQFPKQKEQPSQQKQQQQHLLKGQCPTQELRPSTEPSCAAASPFTKKILHSSSLNCSSESRNELSDTELQVLNKFVNITKAKRGTSEESLLKSNVNKLSAEASPTIVNQQPLFANNKEATKHTGASESVPTHTDKASLPSRKPDEGSIAPLVKSESLLKINFPKHVYAKGRAKRAHSLNPVWDASSIGATNRRNSTTSFELSEENVIESIVLDSGDETGEFLKCDEKFSDSLDEKKPDSPKLLPKTQEIIIEEIIEIPEDEIEDAAALTAYAKQNELSEKSPSKETRRDEKPQNFPPGETLNTEVIQLDEQSTDGRSSINVSGVTYPVDDVQLLHNDSTTQANAKAESSDDLQLVEFTQDDCEVYEILSDQNDSGTQLDSEAASPIVGTDSESAQKSSAPSALYSLCVKTKLTTKNVTETASPQAVGVLSTYDMLTWKDRIGSANGTTMRFELNEYNLLQIHEPCAERQNVHTAYEKPIHERQLLATPTPDSQFMYRCRRCKCYGHAEDFLAPEFCSLQCIKRDNRKRRMMNNTARNRTRTDVPALSHSSNTTDNTGCLKAFSWSTHLKQHFLSCAAPVHLFLNPFPTAPNPFKIGMRLEAIDPLNASLFCVCNVADIQGFRLRLNFDGYDPMYDFWVNADSPDIFPPGFCMKTNRVLQPPKGMENGFFNWAVYLTRKRAIPAQRQLFTHLNTTFKNPFKIGMHLEAEDLHDTGKLCVASVGDVLGDRIRIHFDGWDSCYDYWVHINSPYLHPCGYHEGRHQLIAPPEYDQSTFDWSSYLSRHHSWSPADKKLFEPRDALDFRAHMKLEIVDERNPMLIRPATVLSRSKYRLKLHLDGWPDEYVVFSEDDSPDLHPVGWCDATGHVLEPPPGYKMLYVAGSCGFIGCRGIGNTKNTNASMHGLRDHCPYALHNWQTKLDKPKRLGHVKSERKQVLKASISKIQQQQRSANSVSTMHSAAKRRLIASKVSADYNAEFEKMVISTTPIIKPPKIEIESENENRSILSPPTFIPSNNVKAEPLDLHLNIAKRFLCDYGPRLKQNYKIWNSNFTFDADRIECSPLKWSVSETADFVLKAIRLPALANLLEVQGVDGEALLSLKQVDLTGKFGVKLGHSIKLFSLIIQLRMLAVTKFSERLCID